MKIRQVIGDGSCLIHSILGQVCNYYNSLDNDKKSKHARMVRKEISSIMTEDLFNKLSNGHLKEFISFEDWKKLMDSDAPLGEECLEMLGIYFQVNIYIYWKDMEVYPVYTKHYSDHCNVHIYWSGDHYDIVEA
jgi:hypothetical protein